MSSLEVVLIGLAGIGVVASVVGMANAARARHRAVLPRSHSHNDYEQRWPLQIALAQGFISVEADVWPRGEELLVGHDAHHLASDMTLRRLYLEPLAALIVEQGEILPELDEPFQLLIEIKSEPERCYELIHAQLSEYAHLLTRYDDAGVTTGKITVIITGQCPRELLAAQHVRYAACDGHLADVGTDVPASLVPLCSDDWRWHFRWRGIGPVPRTERAKLRKLVEDAHADGRKVRFWGAPFWPAYARRAVWRELAAANVDYLGADHLVSLHRWGRRRLRTPT